MKRFTLVRAIFACLAMQLAAVAADRPNVILCMADDQGWEETGYNGHPAVKTPVLAEMAAAGDWDKLKEYQDFLIGGREPS